MRCPCFEVCHENSVKLMAVGMALFKGLLKEEYISKFAYVVLSRTLFLVGCRAEGSSSWLAVGHGPSLPCTPFHKELTTWQLAFLKGAQAKE